MENSSTNSLKKDEKLCTQSTKDTSPELLVSNSTESSTKKEKEDEKSMIQVKYPENDNKKTVIKSVESLSKERSEFLKIHEIFSEFQYEKVELKNSLINKYSKTAILADLESQIIDCELIYTNIGKKLEIFKISLNNGMMFVLKCFSLPENQEKKINYITREFYINKTFCNFSGNVVKALDLRRSKIDLPEKLERLEILYEFSGVDLLKLKNSLKINEILNIINQLIDVLCIMEDAGLAHLDLKPQNITYDQANSVLSLIDFGSAKAFFRNPKELKHKLVQSNVTNIIHEMTLYYAPPEVAILNNKDLFKKMNLPIYLQKVDSYCFGVVFLELLLAISKSDCVIPKCFIETVHNDEINKFIENAKFDKYSAKFITLIRQCLKFNPNERPTFKELKKKFNEIIQTTPEFVEYLERSKKSLNDKQKINGLMITEMLINIEEYEAAKWHCSKYLWEKLSGNSNEALKIAELNDKDKFNEALEKIDKIDELLSLFFEKFNNKEEFSDICYFLGVSNAELGKNDIACKFLSAALKIYKQNKRLINAEITLGIAYINLNNIEKGIDHFKSLLSKYEKTEIIDKHKIQIYANNNLGLAYDKLGNFVESIKYYTISLNITLEKFGASYHLLSGIYNNLAVAYDNLKKFDEAIKYYKQSLEIKKNGIEEYDNGLALLLNNLGSAYTNLCNYEEAIKCFTNAAEITKKIHGEDNPLLATSYNNLGCTYDSMGKFDQSVKFHKLAWNIRKKELGDEHPDLAMTYHNIGSAYIGLGKYDKSLKYLEIAMGIMKKSFGENYPDLALTYDKLGGVYNSLGKFNNAIKCCVASLNIRKKAFKDIHSEMATTYDNLGTSYDNLGKYNEAKENYLNAVNIIKITLGENHPHLATTLNNLGLAYLNLEQIDEAIKCFTNSMLITKNTFGENHFSLATTYNNFGLAYDHLGEYDEAVKYYTQAMEITVKTLGEDHPDMCSAYNNLGYTYSNSGKFQDAVNYFEKVIKIMKNTCGDNNPDIATAYNNLGCAYFKQEMYELSLKNLLKCKQIRENYFEEDHPDMINLKETISVVNARINQNFCKQNNE